MRADWLIQIQAFQSGFFAESNEIAATFNSRIQNAQFMQKQRMLESCAQTDNKITDSSTGRVRALTMTP